MQRSTVLQQECFDFQVNHEYAAVMFENKVQIHLIDNDDGEREEEKETKLFPDGVYFFLTFLHFPCLSFTKEFYQMRDIFDTILDSYRGLFLSYTLYAKTGLWILV